MRLELGLGLVAGKKYWDWYWDFLRPDWDRSDMNDSSIVSFAALTFRIPMVEFRSIIVGVPRPITIFTYISHSQEKESCNFKVKIHFSFNLSSS